VILDHKDQLGQGETLAHPDQVALLVKEGTLDYQVQQVLPVQLALQDRLVLLDPLDPVAILDRLVI
jgi:hypothetical protein